MGRGDIRDQPPAERQRGVTPPSSARPRHAEALAEAGLGLIRAHRPIVRAMAERRLRPTLGDVATATLGRFRPRVSTAAMPELVWMRRVPVVALRYAPVNQMSRSQPNIVDVHTHLILQTSGTSRPPVVSGRGATAAGPSLRDPATGTPRTVLERQRSVVETVLHRHDRVDGPRAVPAPIAAARPSLGPLDLVFRMPAAPPAPPPTPSPRADALSASPAGSPSSAGRAAWTLPGPDARRAASASPVNIERLADQVVRTLDQRLIAWRERTGRA